MSDCNAEGGGRDSPKPCTATERIARAAAYPRGPVYPVCRNHRSPEAFRTGTLLWYPQPGGLCPDGT